MKTHLWIGCNGIYEGQGGLREESTWTVCNHWGCSSDQGVMREVFHLLQTEERNVHFNYFLQFLHIQSIFCRDGRFVQLHFITTWQETDPPVQKGQHKAHGLHLKMLCSRPRYLSIPPPSALRPSCFWRGHSQNCCGKYKQVITAAMINGISAQSFVVLSNNLMVWRSVLCWNLSKLAFAHDRFYSADYIQVVAKLH